MCHQVCPTGIIVKSLRENLQALQICKGRKGGFMVKRGLSQRLIPWYIMQAMAETRSRHAGSALSLQTNSLLLQSQHLHPQSAMGVAYSVGEVDHLYTFFVQWSPEIYTKGSKKHRQPRFLIREKHPNHYLVVEKNKVDGINKHLSHPVNPTEKKWEIIRVMDSKRRLSLCSSEDSEAEEPEYQEEGDDALLMLSEQSQLLDDQDLEQLAAHMPARTQGYPWQLVYSTAIHGSSLKTLYRNMAGLDSPVLLIIRDMHNKVFGAFSTHPFRVSKYCYGTGETFLFSYNPDFKAYRWSGENSYFVSGKLESLQIGGGGDGFALWLDSDLYRGSSFSSPTFHNEPLSTKEDFIVQNLEVWTLQN